MFDGRISQAKSSLKKALLALLILQQTSANLILNE